MRLEYLAPDALDRRDDLFRCDFREPSGTLIREAAAGAWTAPVVAVTVNGKTPIVVSGFRRIIAAGMAGIATVPVLIHDLPDTISSPIHDLHDAIPSQRNDLPSKDPARRDDASGTVRDSDEFGSSAGSSTGVGSHGVSVETRADAWAAALNAVHPAVHTPHEISGLAGRAARNLRLPVHRILNRMSLPDDPGFRTDIAAASVLSRNALKWCMRSGIDIRKTALTAPFPARERRLMIRLIRRTRMSLSRLRRFIQLLDDI
ncbi:MAG TPA: hypothetical protein PLV45_17050, partial [bacterium]|nr:hypothetical protein [bacterium]